MLIAAKQEPRPPALEHDGEAGHVDGERAPILSALPPRPDMSDLGAGVEAGGQEDGEVRVVGEGQIGDAQPQELLAGVAVLVHRGLVRG